MGVNLLNSVIDIKPPLPTWFKQHKMLLNKEILIGKFLSGNATTSEINQLNNWLKSNSANQKEFDQIEKLWKLSAELKTEKNYDLDFAWNEFKTLAESAKDAKIIPMRSNLIRVAAGLALVIGLATVVSLVLFNKSTNNEMQLASNPTTGATPMAVIENPVNDLLKDSGNQKGTEIDTQVKKQVAHNKLFNKKQTKADAGSGLVTIVTRDSVYVFMLPDNSIVHLNKNSKLSYPSNFNKYNHKVSLTGEAYFEVAPDSTQFYVNCQNTVTRATGSCFNIKNTSKDSDVELIVASGLAEFTGVGKKEFKKLILNSGERALVSKDNQLISHGKNNRSDYKWWTKRGLRNMIKMFLDKIKSKFN